MSHSYNLDAVKKRPSTSSISKEKKFSSFGEDRSIYEAASPVEFFGERKSIRTRSTTNWKDDKNKNQLNTGSEPIHPEISSALRDMQLNWAEVFEPDVRFTFINLQTFILFYFLKEEIYL